MKLDEQMPSWVPEWAISTPIVMPIHKAHLTSFDACGGRPHQPTNMPKEDREILAVRGKIIGKIIHVIDWNFDEHYFMNPDRLWLNLDWHVAQMQKYVQRFIFRPSKRKSQRTNPITRERVLKTLLADGAQSMHRVTAEKPSSLSDERVKELLHAYDEWPHLAANNALDRNSSKVADDLWYLQQYSLMAQRKRLAICEGGHLALVPRVCLYSQEPDAPKFEIAVLHGSRTPIVVIEIPGLGWDVIGQAYVEGMMYGEAVTWKEEEADVLRLA